MTETYNINGETIEWKVEPDEGKKVRENPLDFPAFIQKKYFGVSADTFAWQNSFEGEVPEGFAKRTRIQRNPFTGESKEIVFLEDVRDEIEERKKQALQNIQKKADEVRNMIVGSSTSIERDGWNLKVQNAQKIIRNTATAEEVKGIEQECIKRGRGETAEELAKKQIKKSQTFLYAISVIDGLQSHAIEEIQKCTSLEEIDQVGLILNEQVEEEIKNLLQKSTI